MSDRSALSVESLRCSIGGRRILDSVSFEIAEAEFVSLIGPNGAGKTTLLKCLMRILPFEGGSARINGKDIRSVGQKELASLAAYVPQADSRHLPFTVEEFVMTGRYPHLSLFTTFSGEDRKAVSAAMEVTGTAALASRKMSSLSGGERQLVMIAAALAQGSSLMLLDEPAAFLDPGHESSVMRLLREINGVEGKSVLMVTHDINRAILNGGRCLVLDRGGVAYFGPATGLAASGVLERIYGRSFDYMRHPAAGCDIVLPEAIGHGS